MLHRTTKTSFSSVHTSSDKSDPTPKEGESALVTLKVQIFGCTNLPAADFNGKSDPYVKLELGGIRVKTSVIKKQLNPRWQPKDATFEFPIYKSTIQTRGAFLYLTVWDKDMVGKDYLGELCLQPTQWFRRKGDNGVAIVLSFDDPSNNPLSYPLTKVRTRTRPRASDPKPDGPPAILIKIGLLLPHYLIKEDGSSPDLNVLFQTILSEESTGETHNVFAKPPTQGFGTVRSFTRRLTRKSSASSSGAGGGGGMTSDSAHSDASPQTSPMKSFRSRTFSSMTRSRPSTSTSLASTIASKKKKLEFRINWEGTMIDYEFSSKKAVAGILMLEVKQGMDLPKVKNFLSTGWEMDAFLMMTHGSDVYRTKVVRHDLNPVYGDKFIFFVKRSSADPHSPSPESKLINIELLDWERTPKDSHIGNAQVDITKLIEMAPEPDEETGLYNEEAMRVHSFDEFEVGLELVDKGKWDKEGGEGPRILMRAKYDPHGALRQRFWRYYLKEFDLDHSGQYSFSELSMTLDRIGLDATEEQVVQFFKDCNKDPKLDELTVEEAMRCLEGEFGSRAEIQREKEEEEGEEEVAVAATLLEPVAEQGPYPEPEDPSSSSVHLVEPHHDEDDHGSQSQSQSHPRPRQTDSSTFGHSRESLYDLEHRLTEIFLQHPHMFFRSERDREDQNPAIPVDAIPDVVKTFLESYDGHSILGSEGEVELNKLLGEMGDITDIGPEYLVKIIARATGVEEEEEESTHPYVTSGGDVGGTVDVPADPLTAKPDLGSGTSAESTADRREDTEKETFAPAESAESIVTARSGATRPGSISVETPMPPSTPKASSVFDARQRSTPLGAAAPSSWHARPIPAYKKRRSSGSVGSVEKGGSGTEEAATPGLPGARRVRGQSNPTSPPSHLSPYTFPTSGRAGQSAPSSPPFIGSQSVPSLPLSPKRGFRSLRHKSQDSAASASDPGLTEVDSERTSPEYEGGGTQPSSMTSSAYTEPQGDEGRHLHHENTETERSSWYSVSSVASGDKVDELEKVRQDTMKRLVELQQKLEEKMNEHQLEMDEMHNRKEELEAELDASKRDEKELRLKDHQTSKQLTTLESEVTRIQGALESAQGNYQTLQKKYQEQCNEAETYREMIRRKELEMKDSEAYLALSVADAERWKASAAAAQQMIDSINTELDAAHNAVQALDIQKQENLSLKERIDRLRFELDGLRAAKSSSTHGGSQGGTITSTLAQELQSDLQEQHEEDPDSELQTVVGTDQDDGVETVVTRQKFGRGPGSGEQLGEAKVYIEASAQHATSEFAASEFSQTEPEVGPVTHSMDIQTDIQELEVPQEAKRSQGNDDLAHDPTKSLLLGPDDVLPTPGPSHTHTHPPPCYADLVEEDREKIGMEELAKWHSGIHSLEPVPNGISTDAVQEWSRVKEELGVTCSVIDEIVEKSEIRGPRATREYPAEGEESFLSGMRGAMGVLFGATIFGLIVFSTGRALHPTGLTRDQRLWAIYNDVARAGLTDGWLTHAAVAPAWAVLRSLNPANARLGWVPT